MDCFCPTALVATLRHIGAAGGAQAAAALPPVAHLMEPPTPHYLAGHYSAEDVARLDQHVKNWGKEVALLSQTLPKRLLNLQNVRAYMQSEAAHSYSAVEQMMLEDTGDDPTRVGLYYAHTAHDDDDEADFGLYGSSDGGHKRKALQPLDGDEGKHSRTF